MIRSVLRGLGWLVYCTAMGALIGLAGAYLLEQPQAGHGDNTGLLVTIGALGGLTLGVGLSLLVLRDRFRARRR